MSQSYDWSFIKHTYLHHVTRVDHRHNFSPYNILLYLNSSASGTSLMRFESVAFLPQLFLSAFALPLLLAKKDLASTMLAQTFAFVSFNKVCTSQVNSSPQSSHFSDLPSTSSGTWYFCHFTCPALRSLPESLWDLQQPYFG